MNDNRFKCKIICDAVDSLILIEGIATKYDPWNFNGHKDYLRELFRCIEIHCLKNADYTGGGDDDDPLANFKDSEKYGVENVTGIFLRMGDKMRRLQTFSRNGKLSVQGETVKDALRDIANYSLLALAMIDEQEEESIQDEISND